MEIHFFPLTSTFLAMCYYMFLLSIIFCPHLCYPY